MNGFKFDFSKNFWGGTPSPFPKPLPPFSLGLCSQLGLRSQFMSASNPLLGFALDCRALLSLDSGFTLNFQLAKLV